MTHTQWLVDLALKDLAGLTLTDIEQIALGVDLEEWKRILLLEVELKAQEVNRLTADLNGSGYDTRRRIASELRRLKPRLRELRNKVNARVIAINDRIKQRNIVVANDRVRDEKRQLYAFVRETQALLPFEEPYLDWHVRCAALLEET